MVRTSARGASSWTAGSSLLPKARTRPGTAGDKQNHPLVRFSTKVGTGGALPPPPRSHAPAGRVALVSGGGTGIGRATALELAGSGARVVLCGRRAEPLERVRDEIEARGGEALAVAADLREPGE